MIRKVLLTLIKPHPTYLRSRNIANFSESQKPGKPERSQPQTKQAPPSSTQQQQSILKKENHEQDEDQTAFTKEDRSTWGWIAYRIFFWGTVSMITYQTYLVANHQKKTPVQKQPSAIPYFIDIGKWIHNSYHKSCKFIFEPPVEKFLPDSIHPAMQPKTIVLNLSGTILKSDFVFGKGLTMKRRPGLKNFLKSLSQKYEVIIYSDDEYMFLTTALEFLDPNHQIFMGAFGRESMVWSDGRYTKDLKYLNRDLKNIIVIQKDIQKLGKYKQNGIVLKEFEGDESDNELIKLIPLLEKLSDPSVRDIRKTLSKLGENPHHAYYQKFMQKKQKIKKNIGMLGFFGAAQ